MPFWKAGKNDDQVLDDIKETQKQNADEFVKDQAHAKDAKKSSLIIDNNFTPVTYDPQYILQVNHLKKYFPIKGGMVSKTVGYVKAVDGVTFNLKRGTTMGLVGESGCGKTTTGRTILRLYDEKSGGQVLFNGKEVYDLSPKEMRAMRTKMQIIFARALALNPEFIVCDEPVSALDVSIQAQIINLLKDIQEKYNLTYLFISHDLSVVEHISDTVGVMYLGNLVEYGATEDIFRNPLHPDPKVKMNRIVLEGSIPSPANPPHGCKFHTRCSSCMACCKEEVPVQRELEPGHFVACHLYDK